MDQDPTKMTTVELLKELTHFSNVRREIHNPDIIEGVAAREQAIVDEINRRIPNDAG